MATALAVTGQQPVPGRHTDHGRFTAQAIGFPPQPIGISSTRAVQISAGDGAASAPAFADNAVVAVESLPPGDWQPPLTTAEIEESVSLARQFWLAEGRERVADLAGYAIHALEADGTPYDVRMAYVTFHAHEDARPELLAWVDLTNRLIERSRVEAPPQPFLSSTRGAPEPEGGSIQPIPYRGDVEWNGWAFTYDVSARVDGVSLSEVTYQGVSVLTRASMPAMTVFYDHPPGTPADETCGPFVDRLGLPGGLTPVPWADDTEVVLREFTQYGQDWLEIGILDTLGNYVLYQSWYIGADGQLDAHTFAKGIQCEFDHAHYPFWRFDFALAGEGGDQVIRRVVDGSVEVLAAEFDADAGFAAEHDWSVRDTRTGDVVRLAFDDGSWNVPGQVVPETMYAGNRVYGRQFRPQADVGDACRPGCQAAGEWREPASTELTGNRGQPLDGEDVVVWYRGFLPHETVEGPDLWHSTGVRLQVDLANRYYGRSYPR